MELDNQTNSEVVTDNQTPAPAESAPSATPTAGANAAASTEGQTQIEGQPAAWTPDFKFKVMDKEYEIDEMFRPIIKDEETLKKVRRMQEQVLGLPHLEASRDEFKNKYQTALPRLQEYETVERRLNKLSHYIQNRDFGSFFDEIKIPKAEILKWVKAELDAEELPPHVRQEMERARQIARQNYDAEQELEYYRSQQAEMERNQNLQLIDNTVSQLAMDVANQFNERMQNPTAFRDAVINKGLAIQEHTGQILALDQVISLVKQDLARVMGIVEGGAPAQGMPAQNGQVASAQGKPPVIPAIKAGAASPVKTPPKSIADLKKLAAEL